MPSSAARQALLGIRLVVATLLFIHGSFRVLTGGVAGFGEFLAANHVPFGFLVAWLVTLIEISGTVALASGRLVQPLALYFAAELTLGVLLVHGREGWFVVGGGRNGMEYSVFLIATLLALAWSERSAASEA